MGGLEAFVGPLGLSVASGVNLYATVLVLGIAHNLGWLPFLPESLQALSDPWVLACAALFYTAEFFADKIPFVNTLWDGLHTFIRPVGAAMLALGATDQFGPAGQAAAMLLGGSVALGSHSAKASARLLSNTAAPEPITQSIISVAEDLGVAGLVVLTFSQPWIALGVLVMLIALMLYITPVLLRTIRFLMLSLLGFVRGADVAEPPDWLRERLGRLDSTAGWQVYRAFARTTRQAPLLSRGYLCVGHSSVHFARRGLMQTVMIDLGDLRRLEHERGFLCDILAATDSNDRVIRICLTKDWARLYRRRASPTPTWAPAEG